jgi:predicted DNA-binding protein (UPF0251 family)
MKRPGKGGGGKRGGGRGQKPTQPGKPTMGPRRLEPPSDKVLDATAALEELEKRRRAAVAKAALTLDQVDAEILRLLLQHPSITQEQIGEVIGFTRQTVNERINAPKFQAALQVAARSALEIFESNKARAARKLGALIDSPDDHVAIRASIAHMWPHIHGELKDKTAGDFVTFIQEAYELAQQGRPAPAADDQTGT